MLGAGSCARSRYPCLLREDAEGIAAPQGAHAAVPGGGLCPPWLQQDRGRERLQRAGGGLSLGVLLWKVSKGLRVCVCGRRARTWQRKALRMDGGMDGWVDAVGPEQPGLEDVAPHCVICSSLVPLGEEAPLVRGGEEGPGPPSPRLPGGVAGVGGKAAVPEGKYLPVPLLPRASSPRGRCGAVRCRAAALARTCSRCLSFCLPSRCPRPPAGAAPPPLLRCARLPHVCYPFLSCPAAEADAGWAALHQSGGQELCSASLGFGLWSELLGTVTFLTEPLPFIARHLPKTAGLTPNTCIFIYFPHNLLNLLALSSALC